MRISYVIFVLLFLIPGTCAAETYHYNVESGNVFYYRLQYIGCSNNCEYVDELGVRFDHNEDRGYLHAGEVLKITLVDVPRFVVWTGTSAPLYFESPTAVFSTSSFEFIMEVNTPDLIFVLLGDYNYALHDHLFPSSSFDDNGVLEHFTGILQYPIDSSQGILARDVSIIQYIELNVDLERISPMEGFIRNLPRIWLISIPILVIVILLMIVFYLVKRRRKPESTSETWPQN